MLSKHARKHIRWACGLALLSIWWVFTPGCGRTRLQSSEAQPLPEPLSSNSQSIINGQKASAYPAVGTITVNRVIFCTGTLIAPRVVLSAAHCNENFTRPGRFEFRIDIPINEHRFRKVYREIDTQASAIHPQYNRRSVNNDISVVILKQPILEIESIDIHRQTVDRTWIGRNLLFMGYGLLDIANSISAKRKYSTVMAIGSVDEQQPRPKPNTIGYKGDDTSVCRGDSGGPALYLKDGIPYVLAVTSHGTSMDCDNTSYSYRTDPYVSWIQGFVDKYSVCSTVLGCGACAECNAQKRCTRKPRSSIAPSDCKPCASHQECGDDGLCVTVGSGKRCVSRCKRQNCCALGHFCSEGFGGERYCLPSSMECHPVACDKDSECSAGEECREQRCQIRLPKRQASLCQACQKSTECGRDGVCINPEKKTGHCLQSCDQRGLCPEGFRCQIIAPGLRQCAPQKGLCDTHCRTRQDCTQGTVCFKGTCQRKNGRLAGELCDPQSTPCAKELECVKNGRDARCYTTCGVSRGSSGAPCRPNGSCDAGLTCFQGPTGNGNFCLESCSAGSTCTTGGRCLSRANICFCRTDKDCSNNGKCNILFQGSIGACTSSAAKSCIDNERCINNPGQASVCTNEASATRQVGQACDSSQRCKQGLTCAPFVNVCMENCEQTNPCRYGGVCSPTSLGRRFCLCNSPRQCTRGQICRNVPRLGGVCSADTNQGCTFVGCPEGFVCENQVCNPKDRKAPPQEPTKPSEPDGSAEPTGSSESTRSETDASDHTQQSLAPEAN
ncbi:MAG: trypsin-like serine protease, partial [Myxococcota bacterium]